MIEIRADCAVEEVESLPVGLTFDVVTLYPRLFPAPTDPPFYWTSVSRFTVL